MAELEPTVFNPNPYKAIFEWAVAGSLYMSGKPYDSTGTEIDMLRRIHTSTRDFCAMSATLVAAMLYKKEKATGERIFDTVVLLQSYKPPKEDKDRWDFDSYILVSKKLANGTTLYFACSPALHEMPENGPIYNIIEADSVEGILAGIATERPGWEYPSADVIKEILANFTEDKLPTPTPRDIKHIEPNLMNIYTISTEEPAKMKRFYLGEAFNFHKPEIF